ncbi:MAG: FeoB-associated Cys-rich membrane protein [Sarcina sp.]
MQIFITILIVALVIFIIYKNIKKISSGKCSCDGACSSKCTKDCKCDTIKFKDKKEHQQ